MTPKVGLYTWISVDTRREPLLQGNMVPPNPAHVQTPALRRADPAPRLASSAAVMLLTGITPQQRRDMGLFIGTTTGSLPEDMLFDQSRVADGGRYPSPNAFRRTLPSTIASELTIELGLQGPVVVYAAGAASAAVASVRGIDYVRRGTVRFALVGGIDTAWTTDRDAAAPAPSGTACYMVLALIGAITGEISASPRYVFQHAELQPSRAFGPGQTDHSLTQLTNLFTRGHGEITADGRMGVAAKLAIQKC